MFVCVSRFEEEEGRKEVVVYLFVFICYCLMCVSRHEEEEGLKAAEGRLRGDHNYSLFV